MKRSLLGSVILLAVCLITFFSCAERVKFSGGNALTEEDAARLLADWQGDAQTSDSTAQEESKTYYFVVGTGTVYHSDPDCGHLKNSRSVTQGTLAQALAAGKASLCKTCAKKENTTQSNTGNDRACYYTTGGTVWHYDSSCALLLHSKDVRTGTVEQAMLAGKLRPCTRCGEE